MAEPENNEQSIAEALDVPPPKSHEGGLLWVITAGVIIAVAAAGGFFAARLVASSPSSAQAASEPEPEVAQAASGEEEQFIYHDLEAITVNLNEPRLARYVRAEFTLVYRPKDKKAVEDVLADRTPELKSWLILHLSDCSLEQVRGKANLNRVLREIQDTFNERLWPDGAPLIAKVDIKQWTIQ